MIMWLDNGSTTYSIDNNAVSVTIGKLKRNFRVENFLGATGGIIKGFGTYSPREIMISRVETVASGDLTAWNSVRNSLISFLTIRPDQELFFFMRDGEDLKDLKLRVYPQDFGDEKFKHFNKIDERQIKFLAPAGVWQNDTSSTGSEAITGSVTQTVNITNGGNVECPAIWKYTPTGNETSFQVKLVNSYEFKLDGSFHTGVEIKYNMLNNKFFINDIEFQTSQFLTNGSVFMLPPGANSIEVTCSGPGTFAWEFNERFV